MAWAVRGVASTGNSAAQTTIQISKPTGTVDGDLLTAAIALYDNSSAGPATFTPPSGWTQLGISNGSASYDPQVVVFAKVAGASEPTNYTFTSSRSQSRMAGGIATFYGEAADSAFPGDFQANPNDSAGALDLPAATSLGDNAIVLRASGTWTSPNGFSLASGHTQLVLRDGTGGQAILMQYRIQATAGAVAASSHSANGSDRIGTTTIIEVASLSAFTGWGIPMGIA